MPSTLGIISSHVNYIPPTFSIVPNRTTLNEGEEVTYTITTTNYNSPNIYASNSGTAANADLNFLFSSTIPLVGGTASFTISALNDTAVEGPETIIVNLRTGSTTGPIVATAPTVTINDMTPVPPDALNYNYGGITEVWTPSSNPGSTGSTTSINGLVRDGRWHKFVAGSTGTGSTELYVNGALIASNGGTGYSRVGANDVVQLTIRRNWAGSAAEQALGRVTTYWSV